MNQFHWSFSNHAEKSTTWYTVAASIFLTLIIISVIFGAVLFGVLVMMLTWVYLLYDTMSNKIIIVDIDSDGITLEWKKIRFDKIRTFSILETKNFPNILRINTSLRTLGSVDIYITPDISLSELRNYLTEYIPENTHDELSLIDQILIWIGL